MSDRKLNKEEFLILIDNIKFSDISLDARIKSAQSNIIDWDGKKFSEQYFEDYEQEIDKFQLTFKITEMPLRTIRCSYTMKEEEDNEGIDKDSIEMASEYFLGGRPEHFIDFVDLECLRMVGQECYDSSKIILFRRLCKNSVITQFIIEHANKLWKYCATHP